MLVVFRCDASASMGAGHAARCTALAEALAGFGHRIVFAVREPTRDIIESLTRAAFEFVEIDGAIETEIDQIARIYPAPAWMVLDHYGLGIAYEARCRSLAKALLVLDDNAGRPHDCDLLLDAGLSEPSAYRHLLPDPARALIGPAFALLRSQFPKARGAALGRRDGRPVRSILVSMGATDPANVTETVLDVLAAWKDSLLVKVVLSSRAPHVDAIRGRAHARLRVVTDSNDMAGLMSEADLAIGAAGSTSFERACLGLPTLMVTVADNQRDNVCLMTQRGAAMDCGAVGPDLAERLSAAMTDLMSDPVRRVAMSKAASEMVDGRGGLRVLTAIAGQVEDQRGSTIRPRIAEASDEAWIFELQSQPSTRRFARHAHMPGAEHHATWFKQLLGDPTRLLMIVEREGSPAGVVRLDLLADGTPAFEVSIAVSEQEQGRGIGLAALKLARRIVATDLLANVPPGNSASSALLLAAGYSRDGDNRYRSRAA